MVIKKKGQGGKSNIVPSTQASQRGKQGWKKKLVNARVVSGERSLTVWETIRKKSKIPVQIVFGFSVKHADRVSGVMKDVKPQKKESEDVGKKLVNQSWREEHETAPLCGIAQEGV